MFRRSIFLGLMVVLGSVLVYMVLSARKQEKRITLPPAEIVRQSKPSPTRIVSPTDLQVVESAMRLVRSPATAQIPAQTSARHSISLQNKGPRRYQGFMLKLSYLTGSGGSAETRTCKLTRELPAGEKIRLEDVVIEGLPDSVRACSVAIAWADLAE